VVLNACQKETSTTVQKESTSSQTSNETTRTSGAVEDDPARLSKVPVIVSSDYLTNGVMSASSNSRRKQPGTTGDATAPSVSITSPANGSTVSGTVTVSVSATDNVGVSSVSLTVDGAVVATGYAAPYNFSWNSSSIADGTHTVTAKATDAAGNAGSHTITVAKNTTVTVVPPPPSSSSTFSLQMPPVGYQGSEFSCVAFAVGYAARSAEQFYRTGASSYSYGTNIFSPEFLYDQTKISSDCGSGTSLMIALDYLKNTGICRWQSMPYSYSDGCSTAPNSTQFADAANYKIASYSALYKSDVAGIKTMLANRHPVIFTASLDNSFINAQSGFIWKAYSGGTSISHAMVICGYDDSKHAWKIMNSWGTSWADAGYSWIDYDFLPQTGSVWAFVIN
jgi:hypothetical protein